MEYLHALKAAQPDRDIHVYQGDFNTCVHVYLEPAVFHRMKRCFVCSISGHLSATGQRLKRWHNIKQQVIKLNSSIFCQIPGLIGLWLLRKTITRLMHGGVERIGERCKECRHIRALRSFSSDLSKSLDMHR